MSHGIARILSEEHRRWEKAAGATREDIDRLRHASPYPIPEELAELLEVSNGGEGDLGLPPLLVMLDGIDEIIAGFGDPFLVDNFPGFLFFGGNGGLERIALDCRSGSLPFPVVMIDPIAGPSSAEVIAADSATFVAAIGLEFLERVQGDA